MNIHSIYELRQVQQVYRNQRLKSWLQFEEREREREREVVEWMLEYLYVNKKEKEVQSTKSRSEKLEHLNITQ